MNSKKISTASGNLVSVESVKNKAQLVNNMIEKTKELVGKPPQPFYEVPSGLSQDEYLQIQKNLQLKIHSANFNMESGVEDNNLGTTTLGRKVMRLRGGAGEGEGVPTVNLEGLSNLDKLIASRKVDSHSLLGGSTRMMLKKGDELLKELETKFGSIQTGPRRFGEPVVRDTTNILRLRGGVSQGSYCDSDGLPAYMEGGYEEDDGMEIIQARREVEDFPVLVAGGSSPNVYHDIHEDSDGILSPESAKRWVDEQELKKNGVGVMQSSSGGILVEDVEVSNSSEEDENVIVSDRDALERFTVHRASKAAFAINKNEREELLANRQKMMDLQNYMEKNGLSMDSFEKDLLARERNFNEGLQDSSRFISGRDEFGLPIFINKMKAKGKKDACKVLDDFPDLLVHNKSNVCDIKALAPKENVGVLKGILKNPYIGTSGVKDLEGKPKSTEDDASVKPAEAVPEKRSWTNVVKAQSPEVNFKFLPPSPGTNLVCPPDEVLWQGVEKMKCCVVGTFSKKYLPYRTVNDLAKKLWKGLDKVSQKDHKTFVFKFNSVAEKSFVLSRGTWYLDNKPLLVCDWGKTIEDKVTSVPTWVKLNNVPDCYWTEEGLSRLASAIGRPICADNLTNQLDIMPFAKMCVEYRVGDPLPDNISAVAIDASGSKYTANIGVSYISKPLVCSGCKNLGHLVSACPTTKRVWVKKALSTPENAQENVDLPSNSVPVAKTDSGIIDSEVVAKRNEDQGWTEVKRKGAVRSPSPPLDPVSTDSPPPPVSFKNLKVVDEVEKKKGVSKPAHLAPAKRNNKKAKAFHPPSS